MGKALFYKHLAPPEQRAQTSSFKVPGACSKAESFSSSVLYLLVQ